MNKIMAISVVCVVSTMILLGYCTWKISNTNSDLQQSRQLINTLQAANDLLSNDNTTLESSVSELGTKLANSQDELIEFQERVTELSEQLEDENARLRPIKDALGSVAADVARERKLAAIDPELLSKYSDVYFLNENYFPNNLSDIPSKYTIKSEQFQSQALPFLENLLKDAQDDNIGLKITSAYRSFQRQRELKASYVSQFGSGANAFSADQGYSEHQLGTTIDFVTNENGNDLDGFGSTNAYRWLLDNASEYGFTLSYPADNPFYQFEPWHWRFVGTELANDLNDNNQTLYDLDERELQQYRLELFD